MGKKHNKVVAKLAKKPKKLRLSKDYSEVLIDPIYKNKNVFRTKSCDLLFIYQNEAVPVEVKKTADTNHRDRAICDLLNGVFQLELEKGLNVPYALFVAYELDHIKHYFKKPHPVANQVISYKTSKNIPLGWFEKVNKKSVYVERISRKELRLFPLVETLSLIGKKHINYKNAQRSQALSSSKN